MFNKTFRVKVSSQLSHENSLRFVVSNPKIGKVLDDGQGVGYKTCQEAYLNYIKKHGERKRSQNPELVRLQVLAFCQQNDGLVDCLDNMARQLFKCRPEKFDAHFVHEVLQAKGHSQLPFTAEEFLSFWQERPKNIAK